MAQTFLENFLQRGSDQEKYNEGIERVYGKKDDGYCEHCGYKHHFCKCDWNNYCSECETFDCVCGGTR